MKDVPKIKHRVFQSLIMLIIWPFVLQYSLANYHNTKLWFLITFQELQFEAERHENHYPFVLVFFKLSYAGTYRCWARKEKKSLFLETGPFSFRVVAWFSLSRALQAPQNMQPWTAGAALQGTKAGGSRGQCLRLLLQLLCSCTGEEVILWMALKRRIINQTSFKIYMYLLKHKKSIKNIKLVGYLTLFLWN